MEFPSQLAQIAAAYGAAAVFVGTALRLMTTYPPLKPATWMVLACPLGCILLAETIAMQWFDRAQATNFASIAPIMGAGALAVTAAALGHLALPGKRFGGEMERTGTIDWSGITLATCIASVALWHYWPSQHTIFAL